MDSSKNARPSSFRPLVPGASASLASTSNSNSVSVNPQKSTYLLKPSILAKVASYNSEIEFIDAEIDRLKEARAEFVVLRTKAERELDGLSASAKLPSSALEARASTSGMRKPSAAIDYTTEFEWSGEMKRKMKKVFGIDNFRLCQEGVCNANMDGRDIVCVMPTGGGKSLTYQLPALLTPGCTLVISPLISLITDQIIHLHQAGIEAVMMTGSTPKDELQDISRRLTSLARSVTNGIGAADGEAEKEIKLCYVTPEKIAKSKPFKSILEKIATAGKLARIVIDEAHCVSQLGHDFRPDYKKLSILRQLFPHVPILALSATCPPAVLEDLLNTLRLNAVVDGKSAPKDGTIYFSAPLYRKNLHYKVLPKPSAANAVIQTMVDYILKEHPHDSGIVYCLSKKDTETVALGLQSLSNDKIKTGVYHSDVDDNQKERLHHKWRNGTIQVVCATIAFGLGIDKGNVRFVLHHSMSKSMDGFYQESGRAGRDGKDADCVLYYRAQDASRLSSLICGEIGGQEKLHDMLRFAQELHECRKLLFARYFSASSSLSLSAWDDGTDGDQSVMPCGHCDNCTRDPDSISEQDVTLEAWQILRVAAAVAREGGRVTVGMLCDLARGNGGGVIGVSAGKKKSKEDGAKVALNLDELIGGKVTMNKDDVEALIIQLVLSNHLKETFHSTAYAVNVYVAPGPQSFSLTRRTRAEIEQGGGSRIQSTFPTKPSKKKEAKNGTTKGKKGKEKASAKPDAPANSKAKRKRAVSEDEEEDEEEDGYISDLIDDSGVKPDDTKSANRNTRAFASDDFVDDDGDDVGWLFSLAEEEKARPPPQKKPRRSGGSSSSGTKLGWGDEVEVIDLASDD